MHLVWRGTITNPAVASTAEVEALLYPAFGPKPEEVTVWGNQGDLHLSYDELTPNGDRFVNQMKDHLRPKFETLRGA